MNRILLLLILLSAFPPLSTDMYLPALPLLQQQWGQTEAAVNLSLVLWFVSYCASLLVYGPISDRVGRRPPLIFGVTLFIVSSCLCALANTLSLLVIARITQAAGAAASTVMAMAIAKDLFGMKRRALILAYIGVVNALAPMLAPTVGGWIIRWSSWRLVFIVQALIAGVVLVMIFFFKESLNEKMGTPVFRAIEDYVRLLKNWRFSVLNAAMALPSLALFSFIAGSPAIYITHFGLSETYFGYLFGFNAVAMMSGAYGYTFLSRWVKPFNLLILGFSGMIVGGVALAFLPHDGPLYVALPMWFVSLSLGLTRPPSNNLLLEQVTDDAGSASSLINFAIMFSGALAMYIISLSWSDKAMVIGFFATFGGFVSCSVLLAMRRFIRGIDTDE